MSKHRILAETGDRRRWEASAAALGYRMPAEWEPQARVWLTEPHNAMTWPGPGCLEQARGQFRHFMEQLGKVVEVATTGSRGIATDDSWIRDYGPIFVVDGAGRKACHDFRFNCWGGVYGPYEQDDVAPQRIAAGLGVPVWVHDVVLEGGSIEVNGRGTVLTTEACLLDGVRNPGLDRAGLERVLGEALGAEHVIWIPGQAPPGDDTGGHIDNLARFLPGGVVVAPRAERGHPLHEALEANWRALAQARDEAGRGLDLIPLPVAEPLYHDFPADLEGPARRQVLPVSYANFLISNGTLFAPVFGQRGDDAALRALEQASPSLRVVPIPSQWLIVGQGGLHCLSQQEPG